MQVLTQTDDVINLTQINNTHLILIEGPDTFYLAIRDNNLVYLYSMSDFTLHKPTILDKDEEYLEDGMNLKRTASNKELCKACIDAGYGVFAFKDWAQIVEYLHSLKH